ncbi:hypothetical protein M2390_000088 [Mycetocola sp. BIGb0189]|nr:lasso RiPP family leader peptide-containing protein [Mycetocola sp. BIGb0189]MCS4274930.1 hypothetical protein [Mycetocola sp. BIGb0189]
MTTYEAPLVVEIGEFADITRGVIGSRHEAIGYFFG